jgi:hypothetical protein
MGRACGDAAVNTTMAVSPAGRLPQGDTGTDSNLQLFSLDWNDQHNFMFLTGSPIISELSLSPISMRDPPTPTDWDMMGVEHASTVHHTTPQAIIPSSPATMSSSASDSGTRAHSPRRRRKQASRSYRRSMRTDVPHPRHPIKGPGGSIVLRCQFEGAKCDKQEFTQKSKQDKHHREHTRPIPCPDKECGERMAQQRDMDRHAWVHHANLACTLGIPDPRHICPYCGKYFNRKDAIPKHTRSKACAGLVAAAE